MGLEQLLLYNEDYEKIIQEIQYYVQRLKDTQKELHRIRKDNLQGIEAGFLIGTAIENLIYASKAIIESEKCV